MVFFLSFLSDTVIGLILKFLKSFFLVISQFCSLCGDMAKCIPSSVHALHEYSCGSEVPFSRYVLCRKCHQVYTFNECVDVNKKKGRLCSYKAFPHHPQERMRESCNTLLLECRTLV